LQEQNAVGAGQGGCGAWNSHTFELEMPANIMTHELSWKQRNQRHNLYTLSQVIER
jgi:hypothetical protein